MKTQIIWKEEIQRYSPVDGGFQITRGTADYVRPIYAPHINDGYGKTRYIYYLGDRPKLVLSEADSGSTADNGSIDGHMVRYAHMFLGIWDGESGKWMEDMETITARYVYGREEYDIMDPSFEGVIRLVYTRFHKLDAMLLKVILPDKLRDKLVVASAGQNGAAAAQPVAGKSDKLEFQPSDAEGTSVYVKRNQYTIADNRVNVSGTASVPMYYSIKDASAYPEGLGKLMESEEGMQPMVVGVSSGNIQDEIYLLLTTENSTHPFFIRFQTDAEKLFEAGISYYRQLSETVSIKTPNALIDSAVTAQTVALDANWDAPVITHGAIGWHIGFAGWRGMYGFTLAGWNERVKTNVRQFIKNQQSTGRITAYSASDSRYNMGEVLVDELMHYWLWSGDTDFFAEEAYSFVKKYLRFQEEYMKVPGTSLYENFLNAWNTDNKWNNGGPGSIATAYTWRAYAVMARIAQALNKNEDAVEYQKKADDIRVQMKEVLWDKDTGVYGEYRDFFGMKRLNTAPDLSSIYTPVDVGVTDIQEGYQILQYSDYAIDSVCLGDAEFKYSSNRLPKFYSSCGLYVQETLNNALAYFQTGQRKMGYKQYLGCLIPLIKGKGAGPGASSHTMDEELENTGHIDFADSASMHLRTAVEGLFGIRLLKAYKRAEIMPGFPEEWKEASIRLEGFGYSFRYADRVDYFEIYAEEALKFTLKIPARSSKVEWVKVNGKEAIFELNQFVCLTTEALTDAKVEIKYGESEIAAVFAEAAGAMGEEFCVRSNGRIKSLTDMQEIFSDKVYSGTKLYFDEEAFPSEVTVKLGEKAGHHTFFAEIIKEDMKALLPVSLEIRQPLELCGTEIVNGEKTGIRTRIRNNMQKAVAITAKLSTINENMAAELVIAPGNCSEWLFVPVKNSFDLTPGENKVKAEISGDYSGRLEGEAIDWTLDTRGEEQFITIPLNGYANQNLRILHENSYDLTWNGDRHYRLPNFYFSRDSMRTITATGRSWWEDLSRGKNGVPESLNLPEKSGRYLTDAGIPFEITVGEKKENAAFTSLYNQFPDSICIPLGEAGTKIYFMLAISTNNMQSRIVNAKITVNFADGSTKELPLINPENIDDWLSYQEERTNDWDSYEEAKPYVQSGFVQRIGKKAHANILTVDFMEVKKVDSVEMTCLSNEVLAGLLGITMVKGN